MIRVCSLSGVENLHLSAELRCCLVVGARASTCGILQLPSYLRKNYLGCVLEVVELRIDALT